MKQKIHAWATALVKFKLKAKGLKLTAVGQLKQVQLTNRLLLRPSAQPSASLITMTAWEEGSVYPNKANKVDITKKQSHAIGSAGSVKRRAGSMASGMKDRFTLPLFKVFIVFQRLSCVRSARVWFLFWLRKLRSTLECLSIKQTRNEKKELELAAQEAGKVEGECLKSVCQHSKKPLTNRLSLRPGTQPCASLITTTGRRKAVAVKIRPNLLMSLLILVMFGGIQAKSQTKALQIGDRLPDMVIKNIINSQQGTLHTADLDGKPLVLIFWNSGCRETREAMALVNAWAVQFAASLQILTLAKEPAQSVKRNLLQAPLNAQFTLPVVVGDSLLKQLFPHHTHPHVVWLDNSLRVKSMSGIAELNPKNVSAFIKNSLVNWPQKIDRFDFKLGSSSLLDEKKQLQPYYGLVSPYLQGVGPAFKVWIDSAAQSIHTQVINFPAYKIYLMAFGKFLGIPPNQVVWKVANKDQYVYQPSSGYLEEWQQQHYYCYESVWPLSIPLDVRLAQLKSDLNAALGLNVRMEQRDTTVLRLAATGTVNPSKGGKAMNLMEADAPKKLLKNAGLGVLVYELNQQATNPPVIDETGFTGAVDMELDFDSFSNIQQINKALKPYHLKLEQAKRPVTFLVFEEEKGTKERIKD